MLPSGNWRARLRACLRPGVDPVRRPSVAKRPVLSARFEQQARATPRSRRWARRSRSTWGRPSARGGRAWPRRPRAQLPRGPAAERAHGQAPMVECSPTSAPTKAVRHQPAQDTPRRRAQDVASPHRGPRGRLVEHSLYDPLARGAHQTVACCCLYAHDRAVGGRPWRLTASTWAQTPYPMSSAVPPVLRAADGVCLCSTAGVARIADDSHSGD